MLLPSCCAPDILMARLDDVPLASHLHCAFLVLYSGVFRVGFRKVGGLFVNMTSSAFSASLSSGSVTGKLRPRGVKTLVHNASAGGNTTPSTTSLLLAGMRYYIDPLIVKP